MLKEHFRIGHNHNIWRNGVNSGRIALNVSPSGQKSRKIVWNKQNKNSFELEHFPKFLLTGKECSATKKDMCI